MMGLKKRPRSMVVAITATICICVGTTVYSYHYGYLQGTRETIENSSATPIFPDHIPPMPTEPPTAIEWELHRNAAGELEFFGAA